MEVVREIDHQIYQSIYVDYPAGQVEIHGDFEEGMTLLPTRILFELQKQ